MKKFLAILMCALLTLALAACGSSDGADVEVTAAPDEDTGSGEYAEAPADIPVIAAESTAVPDIAVSEYDYAPFSLTDTGFSMEYPSHWDRQPASKSVCFLEPVADGSVPGRIVVSSKKVEKVGDTTRENQLKSYFANILGDFDTYEWSDIYTDQPFLGDETAHSVTYSATRDGLAYKGYVILAAKGTTIYAYHFRCADTAYAELENVMIRVRDSISIAE